MTDKDLDFSGFQVERKVDVPPPSKADTPSTARKPKSTKKKGKKKKGKSAKTASSRAATVAPTERASKAPGLEAAQPPAPRKPKTGRKKRVNVSLPLEVSRRFTEKAALEERYLTDMVLDAYRDHFAAMRDEYVDQQGDLDLPFRPRRRKAAAGRVTHMLYLAAPEVAVIDGSADELGLSRSEFVSQLLEREL